MRSLIRLFVLGLAILAGSAARAAGPARLDWSAWQHLPVFHDGRMMPLNTFAREAVERVCGRTDPRLAPPAVAKGEKLPAEVGRLFPDGKPRSFSSVELLLSWQCEPEVWEHVPFLMAANEDLRKNLLGVAVTDRRGERLSFVSPADVERSEKLREHLQAMSDARRAARMSGTAPSPTLLDKKASDLWEAYSLYRMLTYDPVRSSGGRNRFADRLIAARGTWADLSGDLMNLQQSGALGELGAKVTTMETSIGSLLRMAQTGDVPLDKAEPEVVSLKEAARAVAARFAGQKARAFTSKRPDSMTDEQFQKLRSQLQVLASRTADLARQADAMHLALYEDDYAPRLLPALNPVALEKNRDSEEHAQPWLSIQAVLHGSPKLLEGYPPKKVEAVRAAFDKVAEAYLDRGNPRRPAAFAAASKQFSQSLRDLGEAIEPVRRKLPLVARDDDLLAVTAYPPLGATRAEVHYYQVDPFWWCWIVNFAALGVLGLSFGILRKPMFWLGLAVLLGAQAITVYGFSLRVAITGWAPVTNMFETVVFVSLVVALLAIWFTLQPMLGPGLRLAWRLNAMPSTWESADSPRDWPTSVLLVAAQALTIAYCCATVAVGSWLPVSILGFARLLWLPMAAILLVAFLRQARVADASRAARLVAVAMQLPRAVIGVLLFYLLGVVPYSEGDSRPVFELLPNWSIGSTAPPLMEWIGWGVGVAILLAAVWFGPRFFLAIPASFVTVPLTLRESGLAKPVEHVLGRKAFILVGAGLSLFVAVLAYFMPVWDKDINPLMPVLRDRVWLVVHVLTITAGYGAAALAWGLGNIALGYYLFGRYRRPGETATVIPGEEHRPAGMSAHAASGPGNRPPDACATLAHFMYKAAQVAVILLAAGTILGGVWADRSWGRFWGWDPKEVWALISVLVYLAILHGRYAGWANNFGMAAGSVLGMISIVWAWYGVNFLMGPGLHSYAGEGGGGGWYVLSAMGVNLLFVVVAGLRYLIETRSPAGGPAPTGSAYQPGVSGGLPQRTP